MSANEYKPPAGNHLAEFIQLAIDLLIIILLVLALLP